MSLACYVEKLQCKFVSLFLYPAILNGGVLCYHYVWRAGGWCPQVWPPLSWTLFDQSHMGLHICMLYVLLVPSPRSQRSTFQILHDNWSQSWPTSITLHGCVLWSGPLIPMILQHDTMIYLPLATILNLLKIDFLFSFISLISCGIATWVFM